MKMHHLDYLYLILVQLTKIVGILDILHTQLEVLEQQLFIPIKARVVFSLQMEVKVLKNLLLQCYST